MLSLSLILTLFCHFSASSSFFFLASSSWEILEVSAANSVACTHRHTNGNRVKSAPRPRSLCSVCSCTVCRRQCVCLFTCVFVCMRVCVCRDMFVCNVTTRVNFLSLWLDKNANHLKCTTTLNLWISQRHLHVTSLYSSLKIVQNIWVNRYNLRPWS